LNEWALAGDWTVDEGGAILNIPHGMIIFRFHARDLNIVMGPVIPGTSVSFRIQIDGRPPRDAHGDDTDEYGNGVTSDQRLYQLIRQPKPIEDREFEIGFADPGIEAFAFTFG
jgi:hypothetical protein